MRKYTHASNNTKRAPLAPIAAAHTRPADGVLCWFPLVPLLAQYVGSKSLECLENRKNPKNR